MAEGHKVRRRDKKVSVIGKSQVNPGKPEMDAIAETDITRGSGAGSHEDAPSLPQDSRVRIGQNLRALYNQIVEQPVPEDLLKLLRELEQREKKPREGN